MDVMPYLFSVCFIVARRSPMRKMSGPKLGVAAFSVALGWGRQLTAPAVGGCHRGVGEACCCCCEASLVGKASTFRPF